MEKPTKQSFQAFFDLIHKNFKLLKEVGNCSYHFWYGDKQKVIQLFAGLSFPSVKTLDQMGKIKEDKLLVICITNIKENKVFGSTIINVKSKTEAEVISFAVHPEFQHLGFGKKMMDAMFEICKILKLNALFIKYRTYWKSTAFWESLLDNSGWSEPEIQLWYYSMPDINTQFGNDWYINSKLSAPYSVDAWDEFSLSKLKETLRKPDWKDMVPQALSPFQMEDMILQHASLLLKKGDEVVGWLICHLLQDDIVQATTIYVHPKKAKGQGMSLMAEAAKRRKLGAQVIFMVEKNNEIMLNLVNKYLVNDKTDRFELRTRIKKI